MTATIDAAGRLVIPKALRERAGLTPGTRVDFRFHEGTIEITPAEAEVRWETRHGIQFPVPPDDAPDLSVEEIRDVIDAVRSERTDQVARAGS
jgi:AbrB family looped-hinge helix DNA binding protein